VAATAAMPQPKLRHRCPGRLRLRWAGLRHPDLRADWLEAWLPHRCGLDLVRVNAAGATLVTEFRERPGVFEAISNALAALPPEAYAPSSARSEPQPRRLADALFSLGLAGAGMLLPQGPRMGLAAGMAAPVVLRGVDALVRRGLTARTLDLATTSFALATGDPSSALGIAAMVVLGDYLRQATEDRAGGLLRTLLAPAAEGVRLDRAATGEAPHEEIVPFAEVRPGDLLLVAPGETLAVDGVVERGQALVNTSVISGESAPVEAACGEELQAGCAVLRGRVAVRALRTGAESATARIAAMMERTLREKSRPELESDRLADRLAPLSLVFGAGIYAATGSARRALSVLTVDYACAVKLSAPVVVKSSMYAAARAGVLAKGGSALDALARADVVVFDKTGTLTSGRMAVREILPAPDSGLDEDALIRIAASAEGRWNHPAARALRAEAANRGLALLETEGEDCSAALGVRARLNACGMSGHCLDVAVGSGRYVLEACGPEAACPGAELFCGQGRTLAHVAVDGAPAGVIALSDELRSEAGRVIAGLRARGVKRVLLFTGDSEEAAQTVLAGLCGDEAPDEVRAGLSPEQKALAVRELREAGACVAVVGDGINDAPALLAADVGVCAAGEGRAGDAVAAITRDAAGIVLLREGLAGLLDARDIAARASRLMRICFGTGAAANSALLVAAGAGTLSPLAAAALHNGTTFALLSGAGLAASRPLASRRNPENS
jgi:Cu2+-exporting ATPase